jgi:Protein of unknwon function (DUF3310)
MKEISVTCDCELCMEDRMKEIIEEVVDQVNSPDHYASDKIECIEYLKDNMPPEAYMGYLEGNVKKYMHRWRRKGKPVTDLRKASWYLDRLIKELGEEDF